MFKAEMYIQRRKQLKNQLNSGLLVFVGNNESPMNYTDNAYHYRQDSTFLYYWGIELASLAAIIDLDQGSECIYGDDYSIEQIIWMGPQPTMRAQAARVGVSETAPFAEFGRKIKEALAQDRKVHFLPQYRHDNMILLGTLLGVMPQNLNDNHSNDFVKAVIRQRSIKSNEEIDEIEKALAVTYEMHTYAMKYARPGKMEREIAGAMEGIALSHGGYVAYPIIFSIHGETLHNHYHGNIMKEGDIAVNDSGAAAPSHYASDITRTIAVSGKFTNKQREIYQIVLDSMESGIAMLKPGVKFKDIHLQCGKILLEGLKSLGLVKGDLDEAIEMGVQGLFFQCGTGHMIGLDVHDMEDLGEELVGYDDQVKRSKQFGLKSLRLAKAVEPGYVVTVEPGIYMIPELIDIWKAENKLAEFINYDAVEKYRDFGGVRIEENVVVTAESHQILGKPIPKTIDDVEGMAA